MANNIIIGAPRQTAGLSTGAVKRVFTADTALKAAARFWFLAAVPGQWIFAYYITAFYGGAAVRGDWLAWNKVLPHGYEAGETLGNVALAAHLLLAAVITVGGPLQLVPQIRARFPRLHRSIGWAYLLTAFTMSATGLYLGLSGRKVVGDVTQHIALIINAVLIMLCAAMALRYAIARDIKTHRRWALRLFLVVSGVWFFRVGLMFWVAVNRGPAGFDPETFQGPFLTFLAVAQYLLPLAALEAYLRVRDRAGQAIKYATAGGLTVLTVVMGLGIAAATMGMWLPRI